MRAVNLGQVVRFFDPKEALTGQLLNAWFVPREGSPRQRMKISLGLQWDEPQKVLLIGHRGSGKSTELNKLASTAAWLPIVLIGAGVYLGWLRQPR